MIRWTPLRQRHLFPVIVVHDGQGDRRNGRNNPLVVELWRDVGPRQSLIGILGQEVCESQAKWRFVGRRERELMGHAVECCLAAGMEGFDLDAYEAHEAASLVAGYDGMFAAAGFDATLQELQKRRAAAAEWVARRAGLFAYWYEALA